MNEGGSLVQFVSSVGSSNHEVSYPIYPTCLWGDLAQRELLDLAATPARLIEFIVHSDPPRYYLGAPDFGPEPQPKHIKTHISTSDQTKCYCTLNLLYDDEDWGRGRI